jgi:malate/lactate dehydrogenase
MVHLAIVGTGRVGGEVAFSQVFERHLTKLSLVDIAPHVAQMTKEELCHAIASHSFDIEIDAYDDSSQVADADIIVIVAGFPRTPEMSRRDLASKNAQIVKEIAEKTFPHNPNAWYFVITNPVDAMTTLVNQAIRAKRPVIGTGTNLETSRFRTVLSRELEVPLGLVEGYVGGEHGEAAVALWSTVKIDGRTLEDYLTGTGKRIDRAKCENYVKEVSREIIRYLGGTRHGPAGSFLEIIRGITLNTGKIISYSRLRRFGTLPESVYVTVPAKISRSLEPDIWDQLTEQERNAIQSAAETIYKSYEEAREAAKAV